MNEMTIPAAGSPSTRSADPALPSAAGDDATFMALLAATLAGAASAPASSAPPSAPPQPSSAADLLTPDVAPAEGDAAVSEAATPPIAGAEPDGGARSRRAPHAHDVQPAATHGSTDRSGAPSAADAALSGEVRTDPGAPEGATDGRPAAPYPADLLTGRRATADRPTTDGVEVHGTASDASSLPTVRVAAAVSAGRQPGTSPADGADAPSATVPAVAPTEPGTAAAPARPVAEVADAAARMVARVLDAVDVLENAPPPRRMTVDLQEFGGVRLHVALRGAEVHVQVQGGSAGELAGWSRDLSSALASRGFTLGDSAADAGDGREQHRARQQPFDEPGSAGTTGRRPARVPTDGDLRL